MFKILTFIVLGYWGYKVFFPTKKIEEKRNTTAKSNSKEAHIIDIDYEEVE